MYCGNCGADISAHLRFCTGCGAPTDNEETRVATEATRVAAPRAAAAAVERTDWPRTELPPQPPRPGGRHLPAVPAEADEQVIFTTRPTFLFVGLGYALAGVSALLLTALCAYFARQISPLYVLPVALLLLLIPAFKHLKRNALKYTLTDAKIEIDAGLIARRTRNIPLRNIQDVTVAASITQRLLGFGDLIIDNASELGGTTVMRNIPKPRRHADLVLRELRRWH